jgi:ribose-phosphate pyrophosphokinase
MNKGITTCQLVLGCPAYGVIDYPGGELQVRFNAGFAEAVKLADRVRIVARVTGAKQILELALLASAVEGLGIGKGLDLVLPYLPYGRADRRFTEGDCHGLEVFGNIVASMAPRTVVSFDTHSAVAHLKMPNFEDVSPLPLIQTAAVRFSEVERGSVDINILYPDEGASKRYSLPAEVTGNVASVRLHFFHATKVRNAASGRLERFDVPEMPVRPTLIVDDICDGGGTFIGIAKELGPAWKLGLYVSHGIFSRGIPILTSYFSKIYCSNSWSDLALPGVEKLDCIAMLVEAAKQSPRTAIFAD